MLDSSIAILGLLLASGCASTALQEAAILDGSFSPEFELTLQADRQEVCSQGTLTVIHALTNVSAYPAWVCLLGSHELHLGGFGYALVSHPPSCESLRVLGPGEKLSWNRELELSISCSEQRESAQERPEIAHLVPQCSVPWELKARGWIHAVPPGKKWPKRWIAKEFQAKGTSATVIECPEVGGRISSPEPPHNKSLQRSLAVGMSSANENPKAPAMPATSAAELKR